MKRALAVVALAILTACSGSAQQSGAYHMGPDDVAATVGAVSITLADVDQRALREPVATFGAARLGQALYLARRAALDEIVGNRLMDQEAKARGIERATLVEREIAGKVSTPTESEIAAWYQANPARVQGAKLDEVRTPIRSLLIQERMDDVRERFLETLKGKTPVKIMLEPPRENVADAGHPSKGPQNARVVLIEFSDFQCPFCQRAEPTVQQVLKTYGDKIRLVYRNYPLPNHPNARPAAEAAACADEQGRFWDYHERLFGNPTRLSDNDLKAHASALGLDPTRFAACFDGHRTKPKVDADIKEANDAGVNGTPAFFVNGRPLEGAQPFEAFKQVIDEELARK